MKSERELVERVQQGIIDAEMESVSLLPTLRIAAAALTFLFR